MSILGKIIQNEGSCTTWANESTCAICPLSKLKKKPNGTYYSCIEALGVQELSEEDADLKYKEVASRILLDETVDDLLAGDTVGTQ